MSPPPSSALCCPSGVIASELIEIERAPIPWHEIGMIVFGLAPATVVAVAAMSLVGGGLLAFGASSMSLVQALAPNRLRGRLTSLFTLLYWGLMPVGGLLGGAVSEVSSARTTMAVFGSLVLIAGGIALVIRRSVATLRIDEEGGEIVGLVPVEVAA